MKEGIRVKNWDQQSDSSGGEASGNHEKVHKKTPSVASSVSEYNEREIQYLDKFLAEVKNAIDVSIAKFIFLFFRSQSYMT